MSIQNTLTIAVKEAAAKIFDKEIENVEFQATKKDFEGDITVVIFALLRTIKGNPAAIGEQIGTYLKDNVAIVDDFNVVKVF